MNENYNWRCQECGEKIKPIKMQEHVNNHFFRLRGFTPVQKVTFDV